VVDETSMVSLTMMARLLDAVRADTRLVLVGDPDQLASIEAGAVLGDLARASGRPEPALQEALGALGLSTAQPVVNGVVTLEHVWRFGGAIAAFARAVRAGDADTAVDLLRAGHPDLGFVEPGPDQPLTAQLLSGVRTDVVAAARALTDAARAGDAPAALTALDLHRVLCAHRRGPFGVSRWTADIERWLTERHLGPDRDAGPGTPGARCWSPRTTTTRACSTATPAWSWPAPRACGSPSPAAARRHCTPRRAWERSPPCTR
jgi:exodeoxyribonuclease V alpha subunit